MRYVGQALCFAVFMLVVVWFSIRPEHRLRGADEAIVSVSISHAGKRLAECRTLSQDELNELPPNMRIPDDCPRERHAVRLEVFADDILLYRDALPPSGLWSDGKSIAYQRIRTAAGSYAIRVNMSDSGNDESFDYSETRSLTLHPGQNLVIDFDERSNGFTFN
ncbi:MAG TPA: hypothetical protein PKK10_05385 [Woeseiaceae bacterium]|nr:hypothetical protein [Woeseiaceae bacterium]